MGFNSRQQASSGVPQGHAILYLKPRDRATLDRLSIVEWEEYQTQLSF